MRRVEIDVDRRSFFIFGADPILSAKISTSGKNDSMVEIHVALHLSRQKPKKIANHRTLVMTSCRKKRLNRATMKARVKLKA